MNDWTSCLTHRVQPCWHAWALARSAIARRLVPWGERTGLLRCLRRLTTGLHPPVWVGLSWQGGAVHVVLHEPRGRGAGSATAERWENLEQRLQHRRWPAEHTSDLFPAPAGAGDDPRHADARAVWRTTLETVLRVLPEGPCHLVVSWPDEALWSTTITLSGPVQQTERAPLLEQELAMASPVPVDQLAWDVRWRDHPVGPLSHPRGWRALLALLARWGRGWGPTPLTPAEGDVVGTCWAMPRAQASRLHVLAREVGFASLALEPHSVSLDRAQAVQSVMPDALLTEPSSGEWDTASAAAALGAACRPLGAGPDVLRRLGAVSWTRWRCRFAEGAVWLMGLGSAGAAGYALGGDQCERWTHETQQWSQRRLALQTAQQTQALQRRAEEQTRQQQREQEDRVAYNRRFADWLQGWAATVPQGVQWQQLSLRPQRIELQGRALSTDSLSRWMDQWPHTLPSGVQHQLQWRPAAAVSSGSRADETLGLQVELSWNPATGGRREQ